MLDADTKRRIDSLRDILVGIIPNPQTQIDHITTGLIYKFIYDMDQESISMGGKASFFSKDYGKYSWEKLFDSKLGGAELVRLYRDAVESFYLNPSAPVLFRDIFKNASSPTTNPAVLKMFLKEINEFEYSNSETLGNAFEYLLSFMGSQGDAGQFRTPRHIIDFVVEIINPQKNETILDPACGTAGFLISAYKHILLNQLSAAEKKKVTSNIHGYDITPEMVRLSQVNMYLHNFVNPNIHEYDTLTSEDRWNDYYNIILANPPFMTPKGGIQPHNRFGVESNRAEVLFTDYILEHLKPEGRAGIIVPEGVIFQKGNAYKELRKQLIQSALVAVISLPAGVFNPYSGVKTSILILDKNLNKKTKNILFIKVENDGFDLGSQRRPIKDNDLPKALKKYLLFLESIEKNNEISDCVLLTKDELLNSTDISLNYQRYLIADELNTEYEIKDINEYVDFQRGSTITQKEVTFGDIPVIGAGQQIAYFHNVFNRIENSITISSSGAYAGYVDFHEHKIYASDCFTVITKSDALNQKFLFYLLKSRQKDIYKFQTGGGQPHVYSKDFSNFKIPLPPIKIQEDLVVELDAYQLIIDACNKILNNYKPSFEINSDWEKVKIGDVVRISRGASPRPINDFLTDSEGVNWIKISDATKSSKYIYETKEKITLDGATHSKYVEEGDFILSNSMSFGRPYIMKIKGCIHDGWLLLKFDKNIINEDFFYYVLSSQFVYTQFKNSATGGVVNNLNIDLVANCSIPLPSIDVQKQIATKLEVERKNIEGVESILINYTNKINNRMNSVWGILH
jgi:type I restriction enzyme M protein